MTTSCYDGQSQLTMSPFSQTTGADLGLSHTYGSSARQVPKPSPAMAAHKAAAQRQHTGEESQSFLPLGWMKPCDDGEGGTLSCPTTVAQSTLQSRCQIETFSLPHHNCSSPEYFLQLAPAHSTPPYKDAAAKAWQPPCSHSPCQRRPR